MLMYLSILDTQDEKEKFTEVYEQYQHFCWYVANQMLGDDHLAEDAVQETFLALTRHMDKIEDVHSDRARNFLATIVRSKAVDILRKKVRPLTFCASKRASCPWKNWNTRFQPASRTL